MKKANNSIRGNYYNSVLTSYDHDMFRISHRNRVWYDAGVHFVGFRFILMREK